MYLHKKMLIPLIKAVEYDVAQEQMQSVLYVWLVCNDKHLSYFSTCSHVEKLNRYITIWQMNAEIILTTQIDAYIRRRSLCLQNKIFSKQLCSQPACND